MSDNLYEIWFNTQNKRTWEGLNGKNFYMDYEENLIENYNFAGFCDQIIAIMMGWA